MNLSVDNFLLPNARKGRSVTEEKVVLKEGDFWMDMVGNGNNIYCFESMEPLSI